MSDVEKAEFFEEYIEVQGAFDILTKLGLSMLTDEQQTNLLKLITEKERIS